MLIVRKHNPMSVPKFKRRIIAGLIVCGVVAFLIGGSTGFEPRWRRVRDGMTQGEVMHALGMPAWTGNGDSIGAGNKPVTRWEYRRHGVGRLVHYYVDFDYIGPGGIPVVFRTERFSRGWEWPSWWPWQRAKARA
jgi:hypothetical protein